jgi:hypothetical protein
MDTMVEAEKTAREAGAKRKAEEEAAKRKDEGKGLSAHEAAEKIQEHWMHGHDLAPEPMSPEDQHHTLFVMRVCNHLNLEANPMNCAHVDGLLTKLGVARHTGDEYPKAAPPSRDEHGKVVETVYPQGHPKAGLPVVFASAEEESSYRAPVAEKGKADSVLQDKKNAAKKADDEYRQAVEKARIAPPLEKVAADREVIVKKATMEQTKKAVDDHVAVAQKADETKKEPGPFGFNERYAAAQRVEADAKFKAEADAKKV